MDQVYTITDDDVAANSYIHSDNTIDPSFCPIAYEYEISTISDLGTDATITRVDKTFTFSYSQDLKPVG